MCGGRDADREVRRYAGTRAFAVGLTQARASSTPAALATGNQALTLTRGPRFTTARLIRAPGFGRGAGKSWRGIKARAAVKKVGKGCLPPHPTPRGPRGLLGALTRGPFLPPSETKSKLRLLPSPPSRSIPPLSSAFEKERQMFELARARCHLAANSGHLPHLISLLRPTLSPSRPPARRRPCSNSLSLALTRSHARAWRAPLLARVLLPPSSFLLPPFAAAAPPPFTPLFVGSLLRRDTKSLAKIRGIAASGLPSGRRLGPATTLQPPRRPYLGPPLFSLATSRESTGLDSPDPLLHYGSPCYGIILRAGSCLGVLLSRPRRHLLTEILPRRPCLPLHSTPEL
jgi:hypothetical protein